MLPEISVQIGHFDIRAPVGIIKIEGVIRRRTRRSKIIRGYRTNQLQTNSKCQSKVEMIEKHAEP